MGPYLAPPRLEVPNIFTLFHGKPERHKAPHPLHGEMGPCICFLWGLRASHLLDPRRVYGPKTMKSLYLSAEVIARNRREMANVPQQEIKVNFPPHLQGGAYSNNMLVAHTREEFVMDFMMVVPPAGTVTSRVIVIPGHMKRMISALQDNVKKYEARFGTIQAAEEPTAKIGFQA